MTRPRSTWSVEALGGLHLSWPHLPRLHLTRLHLTVHHHHSHAHVRREKLIGRLLLIIG